jgi:hypothetical protein
MFSTDSAHNTWTLIKTFLIVYIPYVIKTQIPVTARSKSWICGRSLAGISGSNTAGGMDVCLLWVLCVAR